MHSKYTTAQNELLVKDDVISNERKLLSDAKSQIDSLESELGKKNKLAQTLTQENQNLGGLRDRKG